MVGVPLYSPFSVMVRKYVLEGLGIDLPNSLNCFCLPVPHKPLSRYKRSDLPHLLSAAKCLILVHWKSSCVTSEKEWMGKVREIMKAEEWLATCKHKREGFNSTWANWKKPVSGSVSVSYSLDMALMALADPTFILLALADRSLSNAESPSTTSK